MSLAASSSRSPLAFVRSGVLVEKSATRAAKRFLILIPLFADCMPALDCSAAGGPGVVSVSNAEPTPQVCPSVGSAQTPIPIALIVRAYRAAENRGNAVDCSPLARYGPDGARCNRVTAGRMRHFASNRSLPQRCLLQRNSLESKLDLLSKTANIA